jgi:integrase
VIEGVGPKRPAGARGRREFLIKENKAMNDEIKVSVVKFRDRPNLMLKCIDPATGKQKYRSAKTIVRREAERAAAQWETELREGIVDCRKVTWSQFRQRYETEVLASLADATDQKVQGVFNAVEKHVGPIRLRDLSAERISLLQFKLRDAKLAETTIKGHLAHLLAALRWAVNVGLLAKVPKIKIPKRAKGATVMKGRPITGEEFDRMLAKVEAGLLADRATDDKPKRITAKGLAAYRQRQREAAAIGAESWRYLLKGLWLSGLRIGEAMELHWERQDRLRVDLQPGEHPMLQIPGALEKGNQDRLLAMAPEFAEFLSQTPPDQRKGFVFNPLPRSNRSSRLGVARAIKTISDIGEKAGIKVNTDQAGKVKYASAHDLRRSFGLRWASRVMPQVLMELMRHESIETTLHYYVGRNAQSTAAVLWDAHRKAAGYISGYSATTNANQPEPTVSTTASSG